MRDVSGVILPATPDLWSDPAPIRADLFGQERLEHHAISLAAAQTVTGRPRRVKSLAGRMRDNADLLLAAYRANALAIETGLALTPAAEWLLDNFHIVETQLRQIRDDLPPGYYRNLPKLAEGPLAGYPRVMGLAWAYVAHTDSLVAGPGLLGFVKAYQTVQPLTIGELWAVAITLRIVLIENMRRLAVQIAAANAQRNQADAVVNQVLAISGAAGSVHDILADLDRSELSDLMAAQISKRLRGMDPSDTPLAAWLDHRLQQTGRTVDGVVAFALARQGASNVTMRNIVTSMRRMSEIDWADMFEASSLVEESLSQQPGFAAMDFATRNDYRSAIEVLARGSAQDETAVTQAALAQAAQGDSDRTRDVGYVLIGDGLPKLQRALAFAPTLRQRLHRLDFGLAGYLGALVLASTGFLVLAGWLTGLGGPVFILTLAFVAAEAGIALVHLGVTRFVSPRRLPGLSLKTGVPAKMRTLVAVPVLLANPGDLARMLELLEVHHLSSIDGAVHYALVSDGPDSDEQETPADRALIAEAVAGIAALNAAYPMVELNSSLAANPTDTPTGNLAAYSTSGDTINLAANLSVTDAANPPADSTSIPNSTATPAPTDRFFLLHRHRRWNAAEGVWMGWERKRGKLAELNRLLRGATDTSFLPGSTVPEGARFVVTLDADTRLSRDTVRQLIGKMAHPLNRPVLDPVRQRVTAGYGILQPHVSPALPIAAEGSAYLRITSTPGGVQPYAAASSDIYQDMFREGSFTGKGIYDVDAFEAALAGRVPDNSLLSHDLFEGAFARAGLASDIQVIEEYPTRHDVDARRQHRWVRGDWQLLPWITGIRPLVGGISALNRWKMIDNLRRSLVAPLALLALFAGWMQALPQALAWTAAVLVLLSVPKLIGLPLAMLPGRAGFTSRSHLQALLADTLNAGARIALSVLDLADTAAQMLDAVARSLIRLRTGRQMLEWMTAAQSSGSGVPGLWTQYRLRAPGVGLGLAACAIPLVLNPQVWPLVVPFAALWLAAPAITRQISLPGPRLTAPHVTDAQKVALRLIARRTWRYFETFVTKDTNFLPPDNFQETPMPVVANRTSPTNIGLYLLSVTVAVDMGWIGQAEGLLRLEQTLATMQRMPGYLGHLYNWHDTTDLRVLEPAYVSTVDSGNLAGHLIAVAQACLEWQHPPVPDLAGVQDTLTLLRQALDTAPNAALTALADQAAMHPAKAGELAEQAAALTGNDSEVTFWARALVATHASHLAPPAPPERAAEIATTARRLAMDMRFDFLLQPEKKLLSIGYSVATHALDANCYDLLGSEAQLASLFAIAKGDVETRHWFRLGRGSTPVGAGSALISWSGSMFEYLMPALVLRTPEGSLLEETHRRVVDRQQDYAAGLGMPWGISESAYNARDLEMTYQYSNFGIPGLGLKRGLHDNKVIAPYATGLAAMIDPQAALANYAALRQIGAEGRFGFYEALDFTKRRLLDPERFAIVRSFMAHHQGMTITALANVVHDGRLRTRFHADPVIQSAELLLQERVARDVAIAPPRAREVSVAAPALDSTPKVRSFDQPGLATPTAHVLSNGTYSVVLTPDGGGYSRWGDLAITRWRPDPTQARNGTYVYLRDVRSGGLWSAAVRPTLADGDHHHADFSEHLATYAHRSRLLSTRTEVLVSAEDDAEARRVTLTNTGRHPREIDVTSYVELALAQPAADQSHQAFSKMFVVTDYLPELGVLIATRRKRSPSDPEIWAAHIAVVEGVETAPLQYETDRARFIGRGSDLGQARMDMALSGTTGTVLDPIFALRRRVMVPAGGRARITFWTMVAASPDALLLLVDRHRDGPAFGRAATLAWTQGQVQLRHMGLTSAVSMEFQRLAGMLLRGDTRLRASRAQILAGAGPQSDLWALSLSGDLPILLFLINDAEDLHRLTEVLAAVEYLRMKHVAVDLVILNDRLTSYVQDLQGAIESTVRAANRSPDATGQTGGIHVLRADLTTPEARAHLRAAAAVILVASRGSIGAQLDQLPETPVPSVAVIPPPAAPAAMATSELEFFNGTGGFAQDGREYVTVLRDGQTTPAPWINVIANPGFGFQVSAEGSGFTWADNARENQLTPWSNDPVRDPAGEVLYLQDMESGQTWTPTALPIRTNGVYIARHGMGYSSFQHTQNGIAADLVQFVPKSGAVKITRLTLQNVSARIRTISVTAYVEWVLGTAPGQPLITQIDLPTGAILVRNPKAMAFPGKVAFADLGQDVTSRTCDRAEVLGRTGSLAAPARLSGLSGRAGPGLDPCAALQRRIVLLPGQKAEAVFQLGQAASVEDARALILATRTSDAGQALADVKAFWADLLGKVHVRTPDRAFDIMLNGWLLYQTVACRLWARAGFYQASGAYGFRDQLQDGMAVAALQPEMTRAHLLRAAGRQFPEGDVQHWWLPHSGQGVRTRISDDRVWLSHCVAHYVAVSGDLAVLDEEIPFLDGPALAAGEADAFYQPGPSDHSASLFEHCALGLDQAIAMTGSNGMPLIGTGDWNDGMNRVGAEGRGTSVWLGWLLIATLNAMAPLADTRDPVRAAQWRAHAERVRLAIEDAGWDGQWYRRGTYDDGSLLGSATSQECQIDSIAQSWAVLSGVADPVRSGQAMASMTDRLLRPGLALLFDPPFDRAPADPGYIKGYPPGLRENGGQYSHAAMWAILAQARLGHGAAAADLFARLNPINHALTPSEMQRYKVEPYVIAADVYAAPGHEGRGGWTWYTGSAAWMQRAGVEGIIGLTRQGQDMRFAPCLPASWPEITVTLRLGPAPCAVRIVNHGGNGVTAARLNGEALPCADGALILPLARLKGDLILQLGTS